MGLDTSHNCWHGPYSSFNEFRRALAACIGIDLSEYMGYGNESATKDLSSIEHGIMPLLNHSDCEGELSVEESRSISEGLSPILNSLSQYSTEEIDRKYKAWRFKERIEKFRDGCLLAIENNEVIDFH
jgi:hypothetical protein